MSDVGRLIGDEFNKGFFLEYFQYPVTQTSLEINGLPPGSAQALLTEMNGLGDVLNASLAPAQSATAPTVINANLSTSTSAMAESVQGAIFQPINAKLGKRCFSVTAASETRVQVQFSATCADAETLARLDLLPPASLMSAPSIRRDDIVKNPTILKRMSV